LIFKIDFSSFYIQIKTMKTMRGKEKEREKERERERKI